jgi:hypothetical protein
MSVFLVFEIVVKRNICISSKNSPEVHMCCPNIVGTLPIPNDSTEHMT